MAKKFLAVGMFVAFFTLATPASEAEAYYGPSSPVGVSPLCVVQVATFCAAIPLAYFAVYYNVCLAAGAQFCGSTGATYGGF